MAKKALPNVPNSQDRQQLQFQQAIKELVEVGEGVRGDPLDRKITLRDLLGSGIGRLKPGFNAANTAGGNGILPGFDNQPDMRTPPKPTGVTVTSGLGTIFINWDSPRYGYHGFTRLYRSGDDNFANASIVGVASGSMYVDNLHGNEVDPETGEAQGYYYWVTFVSEMGIEGPPHDANGIYGTPSMDPEYMLQVLQGSITEGQLYKDLVNRIDLIDGPDSMAGSVSARLSDEARKRAEAVAKEASDRGAAIQAEQVARADADSNLASNINALSTRMGKAESDIVTEQRTRSNADTALASDISSLSTRVGKTEAGIATEQQARASADSALSSQITQLTTKVGDNTATIETQTKSIDGLSASFTVKIDANGRVAGYGLASEPNESGSNTSSFVINADRFAIFHPGAKEQLAFGVEAGKTVMDGAHIKSASIKSASIESLAANKIVADSLSAISANMGTITAGRLQSVDNRVIIDMTLGTFSVRSGTSGARMEMKDNVIKVYDANGVLRVKLGNLSA